MFDTVTGRLAGERGRGGAKARDGVHGDPRKLLNVDMRSTDGRRYRAIAEALIVEFPEADSVRLRELASLKYGLEQFQSLMVGGNVSAADNVVRLSNLITRRENALRRRMAAAPVRDARPLHERLRDMPVAKASTAAKDVKGSRVAATRIGCMAASGVKAANAFHDDDEGEDG